MKISMVLLSIIVFSTIVILLSLGSKSKQGMAPGLTEGKLSACKAAPNCVCSEHKDDKEHYVDPIELYIKNNIENMPIIKNIISGMGGRIESEKDNYLSATFTSDIFKFVDDLEIRMDMSQGVAHVRSRSRVGYADFNANKKRIEKIRKQYRKRYEANKSL